ncbi:MAG: group 1 glycosyl transferase, partial [Gammaproteobacteria bacterium]|nr:group 1 glycosyl transferase [Gammaproteobacteria bacterium]
LDRQESRKNLHLPVEGVLIGTAGALDASRGIDTLYQAFMTLADEYENLHLVLAGRMDRQSSIPQHERVHF